MLFTDYYVVRWVRRVCAPHPHNNNNNNVVLHKLNGSISCVCVVWCGMEFVEFAHKHTHYGVREQKCYQHIDNVCFAIYVYSYSQDMNFVVQAARGLNMRKNLLILAQWYGVFFFF